jgi:hypothetical protein
VLGQPPNEEQILSRASMFSWDKAAGAYMELLQP